MNNLSIRNVSKSFETVRAVRDLSLDVPKGQIFGLLGPNGAGKTTTIRMIMRILLPDSGTIELFGKPLEPATTDRIGYMPEERGLYQKMKTLDVVAFFGEIKGMSRTKAVEEGRRWMKKLDIQDWMDKKVETLSKGMQQKIQFIGTILHRPDLLILDEPFSGLDPVNVNVLKDAMLELRDAGTTVIFSTHQMEQVEKLCDALCLINRGESVLQGRLSEVKSRFGRGRVQMQYEGDLAAVLRDRRWVEASDDFGKYVEIKPAAGVSAQDLLKRAMEDVSILRFEIAEPSLNEIFIQIVRPGEAGAGEGETA